MTVGCLAMRSLQQGPWQCHHCGFSSAVWTESRHGSVPCLLIPPPQKQHIHVASSAAIIPPQPMLSPKMGAYKLASRGVRFQTETVPTAEHCLSLKCDP